MAGEKKVSQSGNKASQALSKSSCPESTQKTVPVFPIRYSVKPKDIEFEVDGTTLGFPEMKHSSYAMRLLRSGYVYLYDKERGDKGLHIWEAKEDGTFQKIVAKLGAITSISRSVYDRENEFYELESRSTPYILARAEATEVYVGFSDALWTSDIFEKIIANRDNIRTNLMTKIDVKRWEIGDGVKTFDIEDLDFLVEEYRDNAIDLSWSPFKRKKPTGLESSLAEIKRLNPDSEIKTIGVMLYDNIGLVVDQGGIVDKYRVELNDFLKENAHAKIISECVEMVYANEVSKNYGGKSVAEVVKEKKKRIDKYRNQPKQSGHRGRGIAKFLEENAPQESYESVKSKVFEQHAKHKVENIREEERLKFLEKYNKKYSNLARTFIESKNDRYALLNSYEESKKPSDLGSSFLNYDIKNRVSADLRGQAFAQCTAGMMSDPVVIEKIENREHGLFRKWWKKEEENPILEALQYSYANALIGFKEANEWAWENKTDTLGAVYDALLKAMTQHAKYDDANSAMRKRAIAKVEEIEEQIKQKSNSKLEKLNLKKKQLLELLRTEEQILHSKYTVTAMLKNIATLTFTKPHNWNGAIPKTIDEFLTIKLFLNSDTNLKTLVAIFNNEDPTRKTDYKSHVNIEYLMPDTYMDDLSHNLNITTEEKAILHDHGLRLVKDECFKISYVSNIDILERQLKIDGISDKIDGVDEAINHHLPSSTVNESSQGVIKRYGERVNPLVGAGDRVLSPLLLIFNAVNLEHAVDAMMKNNKSWALYADVTNLLAAITGTTSALFGMIDAYTKKTIIVSPQGVMSIPPSENRLVKYGRRLGYLAAFFDAATQTLNAIRASKEGNRSASQAYGLSAILLGGGGFLVMSAFLAGAIVLVAGMYILAKAIELDWKAIDHWLNACYWGGHREFVNPKLFKYQKSEHEEEYMEFIRLMYLPMVTFEWKSQHQIIGGIVSGRPIPIPQLPNSNKVYVDVTLPLYNSMIEWGHIFSIKDDTKPPRCSERLNRVGKTFHITFADTSDNKEFINFSIVWRLPFKNKKGYSIQSNYILNRDNINRDKKAKINPDYKSTVGGAYGSI